LNTHVGKLPKNLPKLAWASSRLEGNTYTQLDTQNLIELGHVAQGKDTVETQMVLNHKAAVVCRRTRTSLY
jgi:Fic family protein